MQASRQCLSQFAQLRRLAQYAIHMERSAPIRNGPLSPTRQQYDDRVGGRGLHRGADLAPINVGHPEIGYHDGKRIPLCVCRKESVDTSLAAARRNDGMAIALERVVQRFEQHRIVVHDQDPQIRRHRTHRRGLIGHSGCAGRPAEKLKRTVVPWPTALSMSISAPCRCTIP